MNFYKENLYTSAEVIEDIAKDKETLVFVEVKARKNDLFGEPKDAVGYNMSSITASNLKQHTKEELHKILKDKYSIKIIDTNTYVVKSGDNLYAIANRYGVSVNELKNYNNLSTNNLLNTHYLLHVIKAFLK